MKILFLLCFGASLCITTSVSASSKKAATQKATMQEPTALRSFTSKQFLNKIISIESLQPFTMEKFTKERESQKRSDGPFSIHYSEIPKDSSFRSVELRSARGNPSEVLLILEVSPRICVTQKETKDLFSLPQDLTPSSAHAQEEPTTTWTYIKSWGELRLVFSARGKQCLTTVIFDSTKFKR